MQTMQIIEAREQERAINRAQRMMAAADLSMKGLQDKYDIPSLATIRARFPISNDGSFLIKMNQVLDQVGLSIMEIKARSSSKDERDVLDEMHRDYMALLKRNREDYTALLAAGSDADVTVAEEEDELEGEGANTVS